MHKDINKLKDEMGEVQTEWEDIIEVAQRHFTRLIGATALLSEEALERVLKAQTTRISAEVATALDAPIKLEELIAAMARLAKGKMHDRDSIPMEFYTAVWDHIGPMLLEVICDGLRCGNFHPNITHGITMLLKKNGDQLFLDNKRGLTLLNYVLKILIKLY